MARKGKGGVGLRERLGENPRAAAGMIAVVMVLGSAAVAWGFVAGTRALERRAGELLATNEQNIEIVWPTLTAPPEGERAERTTWLPSKFREELLRTAHEAAAQHPGAFDAMRPRAVGEALYATGWFASPPSVSTVEGGAIRVEGEWRLPAAAVRSAGLDYLVSWDRRRLPHEYPVGQSGQRVIVGVQYAPPSDDGKRDCWTVWPGEDLEAGLVLLRTLRADSAVYADIADIDVSDFAQTGSLTIVTQRGSRVVWGGRPDAFQPGEISAEDKMDRLRTLKQRYGSIDAGQRDIEIAWDRPLVIDSPGG